MKRSSLSLLYYVYIHTEPTAVLMWLLLPQKPRPGPAVGNAKNGDARRKLRDALYVVGRVAWGKNMRAFDTDRFNPDHPAPRLCPWLLPCAFPTRRMGSIRS